jgi:HSP20 family protein
MTIVQQKPVFINQLFDELFAHLPQQNECNNFGTAVNIHETNDGFHLELNAPARKKEDFKMSVEKDVLTISYQKKEDTENKDYKTLRKEFAAASFKRSFNVDKNIDTDLIKAKYEDGILSVYLPKKEAVKVQPKEINIL